MVDEAYRLNLENKQLKKQLQKKEQEYIKLVKDYKALAEYVQRNNHGNRVQTMSSI